jgi:hypothetical protein
MTRLELTYRRLMLAYPRGFRRERGLELLTMLMDAARPDQRRPTAADAADLVLGGLRWRLRLPRGVAYRLVAVPAALFVGLVAAGATTMLLERHAPTGIEPARAAAVAGAALADQPDRPPARFAGTALCLSTGQDAVCESITPDGADPMGTVVQVGFDAPIATVTPTLTAARDRLAAEGWAVGPVAGAHTSGAVSTWPEHTVFWAARDDVVLRFAGDLSGKTLGSGEPAITVHVFRQGYLWYGLAAGAALLAGAVGGWLLVAWLLRRWPRLGPAPRLVAAAAAGPGTGLAVLLELAALGLAARALFVNGWGTQDWLVVPLTLTFIAWVPIMAGALLLVAGVVTAVAPRAATEPTPTAPTPA